MEIITDYSEIRKHLIREYQEIASKWAASIMNTSYVPFSGEEADNMLAELTNNAITIITTSPFNHQMAREIGASLVKLHFTQPEALGYTLDTLSTHLLAAVPQKNQHLLIPMVLSLMREIGIGFSRETQNKILKEQQELREAVERGKLEAERARRNMEARNRAILHALPDAMYIINLDGTIQDYHVNHPDATIAPVEEFLGKNLKDILSEELADNFYRLAQKARQSGEVQVHVGTLGSGVDSRHYEFRIVPYLDGKVLTIVRDITNRVRMDAELKQHRENLKDLVRERTRQLRLTNERLRREIDERLIAEERLRESKEQLEIIVNGVADGIVLMDANMHKLVANPAAAHSYGYDNVDEYLSDENVVANFEIMYENGDPVPLDELPVRKAARGEEFPPMMLRYRFKGEQEELWSLVQATPIIDNRKQVQFIVIISHDFTEHKRAEEDLREARSELEKRVRERTAQLATTNQQLQLLTREMINAQEHERRSIARDLHDVVLSQIGAAMIMLDENTSEDLIRSKFQSLTEQIRNIINGLRPPMLNFGLESAIDEMCDDLIDQASDGTEIHVKVDSQGTRYNPEVELHLYRILQQACDNALRHAQANQIYIRGHMKFEGGRLVIIDDGVGMAVSEKLDLANSLSNKNYGLAGMFERAELIGANLSIQSQKGGGTQVEVVWNSGN